MSEPFLAEVRMIGFNFAPRGWAFCSGQILPINQNQSLYSLLGTTYGGDGRTTFALPDLRGRTPIHPGSSNGGTHHPLGQRGGQETHTLTQNEMPAHNHTVQATGNNATRTSPAGSYLASNISNPYGEAGALTAMNAITVNHVGGSQAHNNMQPYTTLNFCIALQGLFPSRN
jgi:microcystin-dependent protein